MLTTRIEARRQGLMRRHRTGGKDRKVRGLVMFLNDRSNMVPIIVFLNEGSTIAGLAGGKARLDESDSGA